MSHIGSIINIPAYDASGNGLIIELRVTLVPSMNLLITSTGNIASALQRNFKRIIEIMAAIKQSWKCLESFSYVLDCSNEKFLVKNSKSSSMALSIALINAYRAIKGKPQISGLTGTGILRIDGSFENAHLEDKKYQAARQNINSFERFIIASECRHLYDLEKLMNQHKRSYL